MGQMVVWALGLLMNSSLWGASGAQRPQWYHGGLDRPYGMTLAPSQMRLGFIHNAQTLLGYCYWVIIGTLAAMAIYTAVFFTKQVLRAQKKQSKTEPSQQGDPEEVALMEALHLLDAVMEKTWSHLQRLERRRGSQRAAKAFS